MVLDSFKQVVLDHYSLQLYTRVHNSTNKKSEAGPYYKKRTSMFDNDEKFLPKFGTEVRIKSLLYYVIGW